MQATFKCALQISEELIARILSPIFQNFLAIGVQA
jgi:hypothetical protein